MTELKKTPLYEKHLALGAKMAPFGGWFMPIQYNGIIEEHNWTRSSASLFDICHMGEFLIEGDAVATGLDRVVTQNLTDMKDRKCHYGFMLNASGGVLDDIIVYKLGKDKWMLVVNAATRNSDFGHIKENLKIKEALSDISDRTAKLDIQGPLSREILSKKIDKRIKELDYYTSGNFDILGEENIISRTGYTGELGYELYISNEKVAELWDRLLEDKRLKPAGLGARDTLRLEAGLPLYGQDVNSDKTPFQIGAQGFVDLEKNFIGKEAILKKKNEKQMVLSYFKADSRRSPRHDYKVLNSGKEIGVVTSGSFSPSLERGIGMGYIESSLNKIGARVILKNGKTEIPAEIVDKPFYKNGTARN